MKTKGRGPPKRAAGTRNDDAAATALMAREAAVLAREQAADLRDAAADLRDKLADQRRAHNDTQLLEANEHLVVAAIRSQTMTEAAEHAAVQMTLKAERDFLTGLPNRALLADRLAQSIALAQRHGKRVALMYLDLDNFKDINDSLGHTIGDRLLQSAARRLENSIRHSDTVSRQGGDEFVVLLSEVDAARDATLAAEKLIKIMAEPHLIDGHSLNVTLSIGISLYPDDGADAEAILTNADAAMYHVKRKGGNSYHEFDPDRGSAAAG